MTSVPTPIPSRTQYVLEEIKRRILTGRLTPGQALVETDLAAQFGVSKTPVREALKTLAGTGLVVMSQYKGVTVRMVDADMAREVYDVRLLLEPEALRRAVRRGASLEAASDALTRADQATDTAERSLANREFHRALYVPCGNAARPDARRGPRPGGPRLRGRLGRRPLLGTGGPRAPGDPAPRPRR